MRAQGITAPIVVWLTAAPAFLDFGGVAARHAWILGPIIAAIGWIASSEVMRGLRWVNLPCAVFLAIVAFGPGYPAQALVNHLVVALVVAVLRAPTRWRTAAAGRLSGRVPSNRAER